MSERIIQLQNVRKTYKSRDKEVLAVSDVTMEVNDGEFVSLVGPSGCGKTTVLKILADLLTADEGTIRIGSDKVPFRPGRDVGMVFQQALLLKWRKIIDNVLLPAEILGLPMKASRERAQDLLNMVGLSGFANHYPYELSGGMQQRASIARALVLKPRVLVLDEPTSALDLTVQLQVLKLLVSLQQRHGLSYLLITHDLAVIRAMAHRVLVMKDGLVVEHGPVEQIFAAPADAYTRTLLAAVRQLDAA